MFYFVVFGFVFLELLSGTTMKLPLDVDASGGTAMLFSEKTFLMP